MANDLITRLTEAIDETARAARADYGPWPEFVLNGCAADRKILYFHMPIDVRDIAVVDEICSECDNEYPCPTVLALAEGYGIQT